MNRNGYALYQLVLFSTIVGDPNYPKPPHFRHIWQLEQFMCCFWRIAHVRWRDEKPNTEVLQLCGMSSIEAFLTAAVSLDWSRDTYEWWQAAKGHLLHAVNSRMEHVLTVVNESVTKICSRPIWSGVTWYRTTSRHRCWTGLDGSRASRVFFSSSKIILTTETKRAAKKAGTTPGRWQFSVWCLRTTKCIQDGLIGVTQTHSLTLRSMAHSTHSLSVSHWYIGLLSALLTDKQKLTDKQLTFLFLFIAFQLGEMLNDAIIMIEAETRILVSRPNWSNISVNCTKN